MSARRILRKNAEIIKKRKLMQQFKQTKIFTFQDANQLDNLSFQSVDIKLEMNLVLKKEVEKMKEFAAFKKLGYLVNCQWSLPTRLFVINNNLIDDAWNHTNYSSAKDFEAYISPKILEYKTEPRPSIQQCHSFPFMQGIVDRARQIQVSYTTYQENQGNSGELSKVHINNTLLGFKAIVFQHCMDHLKGKTFFDPEITKGRLKVTQMESCFDTTNFLLREYNLRAKQALEKNTLTEDKFLKIKADYISRISKSFQKQTTVAQIEASKRLNTPLHKK